VYRISNQVGTLLRDIDNLPWTTWAVLAEQALLELARLHEAGGCHGDLGWDEILVTEDGSFSLLNRGWAEFQFGPETLRGNPTYDAPETFVDDGRVTTATDVYVLGLLLFEYGCGQRPFSISPVQQIQAKLAGTPTWPLDMPKRQREWLGRLLSADPRQRPTAREALATLPRPPWYLRLTR
jgi:serine/threonine protein kinase